MEETGLDKRTFKKLFFSCVLYHPTCTEEQVKAKLDKVGLKSEPEIFTQLRAEMRVICKALLDRYPCYMEHAIARKGADYHNLDGTALSYLVHTCEKRCILAFYDYCVWQSAGARSLCRFWDLWRNR
eukprot:COSAG03_NODE_946_length_5235_cov_80.053933_7_plen_127_part_00